MKFGNGLISPWRHPGWCLVCVAAVFGVLAGCRSQPGPTSTPAGTPALTTGSPATQNATLPASAVPATLVPTATPEPLAVTVNGQDITLAAYKRELVRCQDGKTSAGVDPKDCPAAVMGQLVEQAVVEQAAAADEITVAPSDVDAALNKITTGLGGPGALNDWLTANHYAAAEFRGALQADLLRARMVDKVAAGVGPNAEQVHAREILVYSATTADEVLTQLKAGADFATLAINYSRDFSSRAGGGDLGWFPRGVLTVPEVEQAAFSLQPGQTSGVIHSALGYHIIQVLERDSQRPLSPVAEQALRASTFAAWLDAQVEKAAVVKHLIT
jgi:peptidyl-prolyl cis-trans isomerase C